MILRSQSNNQWRTEDLQNGWTKQKNVDPDPPEELESVLNLLRIPHDIRPAFMDQDKPFVDSNGNRDTVSKLNSHVLTRCPPVPTPDTPLTSLVSSLPLEVTITT